MSQSKFICLSMIVKNEEKIITRFLKYVYPIVDFYYICDTGSTDTTKEMIQKYSLETNIKIQIDSHPFQNFGYNRQYAIKKTKQYLQQNFPHISLTNIYLLFLDTDMELKISSTFQKENLDQEVYLLKQTHNHIFSYYNIRLVRSDINIQCKGVTHEYYDTQNKPTSKMTDLWIMDHGDGGCKQDKTIRDIRLLLKGIQDEPFNSRYYFYLGNSFFDNKQYEKAMACFRKRIYMKGWNEEIWYSYYKIGHCFRCLHRIDDAIKTWYLCFSKDPLRLEPIYYIIQLYRYHKRFESAYKFYLMGKHLSYPKHHILFIEDFVYTYIHLEFLLIYNHLSEKIQKTYSHTKISNLFESYLDTRNSHLYIHKLYQEYIPNMMSLSKCAKQKINLDFKSIQIPNFTCSSSSFVQYKSYYYMNVRYVNYTIDKKTQRYIITHSKKHIITKNICLVLDLDFKLIDFFEMKIEKMKSKYQTDDCTIYGIEDIRLYKEEDKILFTGNIQLKPNIIRVCYGEYIVSTKKMIIKHIFHSPNHNSCEKNWIYIPKQLNPYNKRLFIYIHNQSHLLQINSFDKSSIFSKCSKIKTNHKFNNMSVRGSSPGFKFDSKFWFVVHTVIMKNNKRHYIHCIYVYNSSLEYIQRSKWFTFENQEIEYCLGFQVTINNFIFSYSTWDSTNKMIQIDKKYLFM